jgi:ParB-like chromosome segregation protein Spo0J
MNIERVDIKKLVMNPNNPRTIKDAKFKKLVKSIKEFPEMLEVRPIVVDDDMVVLGGNMRTKACISAGLTEVPIIRFSNLSEEKKKEFIVKDNVGYGEWDFDLLLEDWDKETLLDWGMDIKEKKEKKTEGDVEFSEELLLEHNYIVLYFDNNLDWEVACDKLNIEKVKNHSLTRSAVGIGRVINGDKIIRRL